VPESGSRRFQLQACGLSDVGRKRQSNEDSFAIDDREGLFVVADGMGGHAAGEVASSLAVQSIERHITGDDPRNEPTLPASAGSSQPNEENLPAPARRVLNAIRLANQEIVRSVKQDHSMRGMGTTVARNILTRAVGSQEDVEADLLEQDLEAGDSLLLCSDGLTTMLEDQDILETLAPVADDPAAGCRALVDLANERGGDDNVTVVLVRATPSSSRTH
jgi:serine/threonine protein phosphatase PrpC